MKRPFLFAGTVLVLLTLAGCSLNIYEMGLPLVPTVTPTPIPTKAATATPTLLPKAEKTEGIIQTGQLENGATRMVDTELGYQAVFPSEWLVIGLDGGVETQLSDVFGAEVPEGILARVNVARNAKGVRAIALDYTGHFYEMGEFNANIQVAFSPNPASMELEADFLIDGFVSSMATQEPDSSVIYEVVQTNPHGIEYGKMIVTYPREIFGLPGKQMVVILKLSDGLLTLTGSAVEEEFQLVEQDFQRVVDSIELVQ